jgi:hypothetical protein
MIMLAAVLVVLAVRLVVFLVVTEDIVQSEAIMSGDKVDRGPGSATLMIEEFTGSTEEAVLGVAAAAVGEGLLPGTMKNSLLTTSTGRRAMPSGKV